MMNNKQQVLPLLEYFTERRNRDGTRRYYWKASTRLTRQLAGSKFATLVRLPDDRAEAEVECRELTARVNDWLESRTAPSNTSTQDLERLRELVRKTPGTLAHSIASYRQSKAYLEKTKSTRKQYDWILNIIEDRDGPRHISEVTYEWVHSAVQEMSETPRKQQVFLMLLAWMIERHADMRMRPGEFAPNPARRILEELSTPRTQGSWIWPDRAVDAFAEAADALGWPSMGTAISINKWLGLPLKDVLNLPRGSDRDGVLHVRQPRSGRLYEVPRDVVSQLGDLIQRHFAKETDATKAKGPLRTLLICENTGDPWKVDWFRHCFSRVRAALANTSHAERSDVEKLAGAEVWPVGGFVLDTVVKRPHKEIRNAPALPSVKTDELKFSHLRHTGIVRLHQLGCSDAEIRNISGHNAPARVYDEYFHVGPARTFARWPTFPSADAVISVCRRGEDQMHEFKASGTDFEKISREIAAMLNTSCGGLVLYGVDKSGKIQGADKSYELFDQSLQNSVRNTIEPAAHVKLAEVRVENASIFVVSVPGRTRDAVYSFKDGTTRIRQGTNSFAASADQVRKLHKGIDVV